MWIVVPYLHLKPNRKWLDAFVLLFDPDVVRHVECCTYRRVNGRHIMLRATKTLRFLLQRFVAREVRLVFLQKNW